MNTLNAQQQIDTNQIIDYHVHIFSPELIDNLSNQGYNFKSSNFQIIKSKEDYSKISEITKDNGNSKMALITAGYAYKNINENLCEREFVKKENNLLADLIKTNPDDLIGFYGIDPLKDYAVDEILRCDEELNLDGIKLHLQANKLNLIDSIHLSKLKEIFYIADKREIPILIHNNAGDNSFGKKYFGIFEKEILENYNSLTIIFAHAGGGGGIFQFGYDFLKEFGRYSQKEKQANKHKIYFELSGVIKQRKYPGERTKKEFLKVMNEIGFEYFLFGSDYPVRNSSTYFKELSKMLDISIDDLKEISQRNIFNELKN